MQHQCAGLPSYLGLLLLNPLLLATAAVAVQPGRLTLAAWAGCAGARMALDAAAGTTLRGRAFAAWALALVPLKDLLAASAWLYGLTNRSIEWRSHRLTVLRGSVLRSESQALFQKPAESGTGPASATA